jgi:hypothetical protein
MIKLCTDFNTRSKDGLLMALFYNEKPLEAQIESLQLKHGDKVVLLQDECDFEVTGTLEFRYLEELGRSVWVVNPDWSTVVRQSLSARTPMSS